MNNSSNVVIVGKVTKPLEVKEVSTANGNKKVGNMTVSAVKQVKQPDGGVLMVPTFYEVSTWSAVQQENLSKLKNGETVLVQGQLEAKRYERGADNGVTLAVTNAEIHTLGNQDVSVQSIVAVGRVTQDIELEETKSGHKVARIPLALNHDNERTSYVDVEVWDKYAESISSAIGKGSLLTVKGELDLNTYQKNDGGKGAKLRIVNAEIGFMDKFAKAGKAATSEQAAGNGKTTGNAGR